MSPKRRRRVRRVVPALAAVVAAAALAAVLPNPRRYKPVGPSRYVARNSRRILERMRASGFLPEEAERELGAP